MSSVKVGIIGGTGLDDPDIFVDSPELVINTPFGLPSDVLKVGTISGVPCVLLARHGRRHTVSPSNVNYRANIWALKEAGCTHVLTTTACGSLRTDYVPGDIVFLDQFIDRTYKRQTTFYDGTLGGPIGVCHIPMNPPFCEKTRKILIQAAKELNIKHHETGTTVCIEGPRFSTKAESNLFRSWGANIVNMTTVPEVPLAKEIGLCYATIALPTDYDCWHDSAENHVCVDQVMRTFHENCHKAVSIIKTAIKLIGETDWEDDLRCVQVTAAAAVMLP